MNGIDTQEISLPETAKRERPRVCLIDVGDDIFQALSDSGVCCYSGTLGPIVETPNTSPRQSCKCLPNCDFPPPNLHEYDIVIVDLQNPKNVVYNDEEHTRAKAKGQEHLYLLSNFPETIFDPRPLSASILQSRMRTFRAKESITVIFTAAQETIVYQPLLMSANGPQVRERFQHTLYDFYPGLPGWDNISGMDTFVSSEEGNSITSLLNKHNADAHYAIAFGHPSIWVKTEQVKSKNFIPLMTAGTDRIVSFVQSQENSWTFVFPHIRNKGAFLHELLERVLPEFMPSLFPYSTQFAWLADSQYRLPNEESLYAERAREMADHQSRMDAIDLRIDANRQEYGYLHDLLKDSGIALVKTVEKFFKWLKFEDVVNVDETNPALQEEDLRIETDSGLLVVEVKGIGGTSTDSECSQISKIKYRRAKERGAFDVFGLYCVNHQRYLPPDARQNPPFNVTQIQDALNDERGLVTTYDLFKLYFNITRGFVTKEDARHMMLGFGLVTFWPSSAIEIPPPFEIHHNGLVIVFELQPTASIRKGQQIIIDVSGWYSVAIIDEIQVDGIGVVEASSGEVGIKLSTPVSKSNRLWLRCLLPEEMHPTMPYT